MSLQPSQNFPKPRGLVLGSGRGPAAGLTPPGDAPTAASGGGGAFGRAPALGRQAKPPVPSGGTATNHDSLDSLLLGGGLPAPVSRCAQCTCAIVCVLKPVSRPLCCWEQMVTTPACPTWWCRQRPQTTPGSASTQVAVQSSVRPFTRASLFPGGLVSEARFLKQPAPAAVPANLNRQRVPHSCNLSTPAAALSR